SAAVFERVGELVDETRIVLGLTREVRVSLPIDEQDGLRRPRSPLGLDPSASLGANERSGPQANLPRTQSGVGHFENDAAHVFVSEEIVAGELEVILCAPHVAEERITAPAGEEAAVTLLRHH